MAQNRTDRFICDGCGKQFASRSDLQEHERECVAKQSSMKGNADKPMTRGAGGGPSHEI